MRKRLARRAGVTLMELVIAIGLLAIVAAPILGMYATANRLSALAYKRTVASLFAERCMEEMVGQNYAGITAYAAEEHTELLFTATVEVVEPAEVADVLYRVNVTVTETGTGNVLCSHEDILNVAANGGLVDLGGGP